MSLITVLFAGAPWAGAQGNSTRAAAPLGLQRLQSVDLPSVAARVSQAKFTIDDLQVNGADGVIKRSSSGTDTIELGSAREWTRPLRGSPQDSVYVSFQLYVSAATIVDIGGARLGVTLSPAGNSVQVMHDEPVAGGSRWRPLELHSGTAKFGGKTLATLPVLTVRLDPAALSWDLFVGARLMAHSLPLRAITPAERVFRVRAGGEGALLTGLVMADENPLYEDENGNGIDDAFERKHRGGLLTTTATLAERAAWAKRWREEQRKQPPAPLRTAHLKPDAPAGRR